MFSWFFKKGDASGSAADSSVSFGNELEFEPEEEIPPAVAPEKTAPPVATPVVTVSSPPEPPPNVPAAPPSSDDWRELLSDNTTETEAEVRSAPPPSRTPAAPTTPAHRAGQTPTLPPNPPKTSSGRIIIPALSPSPDKGSKAPEAPDLLVPGVHLRAIPEKQPNTPRGWNVKVDKLEGESIWLSRVAGEDEPLPVSAKEVLSLVIFDERQQVTYECPVIKVKAGNPEMVMVGRPLKSTQEKSKLDSVGSRQHFRINTQLPVEVKVAGAAGKGVPPLSGHTRDISRGGLALVVSRGFDEGRELEVRVLSWNFPLQIKTKVIRCDEEAQGKFVLAVAFPDDMSTIARDLVAAFISEHQRGR